MVVDGARFKKLLQCNRFEAWVKRVGLALLLASSSVTVDKVWEGDETHVPELGTVCLLLDLAHFDVPEYPGVVCLHFPNFGICFFLKRTEVVQDGVLSQEYGTEPEDSRKDGFECTWHTCYDYNNSTWFSIDNTLTSTIYTQIYRMQYLLVIQSPSKFLGIVTTAG